MQKPGHLFKEASPAGRQRVFSRCCISRAKKHSNRPFCSTLSALCRCRPPFRREREATSCRALVGRQTAPRTRESNLISSGGAPSSHAVPTTHSGPAPLKFAAQTGTRCSELLKIAQCHHECRLKHEDNGSQANHFLKQNNIRQRAPSVYCYFRHVQRQLPAEGGPAFVRGSPTSNTYT